MDFVGTLLVAECVCGSSAVGETGGLLKKEINVEKAREYCGKIGGAKISKRRAEPLGARIWWS